MTDFLSNFGSGSSSLIVFGSELCLFLAVVFLSPPLLYFFVDANFDGLLRSRPVVVEVRDLEARNTADVETWFSCESLTQVPSTERKFVVPRRLYSRVALSWTHIP